MTTNKKTADIKKYMQDYREKYSEEISLQKQDYYKRNQGHLVQYQRDYREKLLTKNYVL